MSNLFDGVIPAEEPFQEGQEEPTSVVDISAQVQKAYNEVRANDDTVKVLKIGKYEFRLEQFAGAVAAAKITEATAGEFTNLQLLIEGLTLLVRPEDRTSFVEYLENENVSTSELGVITENMMLALTGKD